MTANCYRSHRVAATCARCGQRAEPCHMPLTAHGFFCASCCPACHPPSQPGGPEAGESGACPAAGEVHQ